MSELIEVTPYIGGIVLLVLSGAWLDQMADRIRRPKGRG